MSDKNGQNSSLLARRQRNLYKRVCKNPDCAVGFTTYKESQLYCTAGCRVRDWQAQRITITLVEYQEYQELKKNCGCVKH